MNIEINLKMNEVPDISRHRFLSYIKACIYSANQDYFNQIYGENSATITDDDGNLIIPRRPFVFGIKLPKSKIRIEKPNIIDSVRNIVVNDHFYVIPQNSNVLLNVSSLDNEFITNLYQGVTNMKMSNQIFNFGNNIFVKTIDVKLFDSYEITQDFAIFKTLSPILLNDDINIDAIMCENKNAIEQKINEISDATLKEVRDALYSQPQGLYKPISFVPIECKDVFVKHTLSILRQASGLPFLAYACMFGNFLLKGDPRDLSDLSVIGIGRRRGQGFGYVIPVFPQSRYYADLMSKVADTDKLFSAVNAVKIGKKIFNVIRSK